MRYLIVDSKGLIVEDHLADDIPQSDALQDYDGGEVAVYKIPEALNIGQQIRPISEVPEAIYLGTISTEDAA